MLKKCKKDKYDVMNQLIYIEFKYSAKSQIKNRLKEKMQIYLSQNFKSYKFIYLVSSLFDCLLLGLFIVTRQANDSFQRTNIRSFS